MAENEKNIQFVVNLMAAVSLYQWFPIFFTLSTGTNLFKIFKSRSFFNIVKCVVFKGLLFRSHIFPHSSYSCWWVAKWPATYCHPVNLLNYQISAHRGTVSNFQSKTLYNMYNQSLTIMPKLYNIIRHYFQKELNFSYF